MISMELVSMILCYQLLIYIYVMFLGMSRGGGKIASSDALILYYSGSLPSYMMLNSPYT